MWEVEIGRYQNAALFWPALEDETNEIQNWRSSVTEWRSSSFPTELRATISRDFDENIWRMYMTGTTGWEEMIETYTYNQNVRD